MSLASIQKIESNLKDRIHQAIEKAKREGISQVEIYGAYGESIEGSIEKNDVNTFASNEETNFGIRVIESGKEGFVTTNDVDTLDQSIRDALALAKSSPSSDPDRELPEFLSLEPMPIEYYDETDELDEGFIADEIQNILNIRKTEYPYISLDNASVSVSRGFRIILSSKGIYASEFGNGIDSSFFGMALEKEKVSSFDYDSAEGDVLADYKKDFRFKFDRFAKSLFDSLHAVNIPSKSVNIYLPPRSVFPFFLGMLFSQLNGYALRMGKSKFKDSLGKQVASQLLTIQDLPRMFGRKNSTWFDREGQPTSDKTVLENGVLKTFYYNHYEAKKAGLQHSNGSAVGGSGSLPGAGPKQIQVVKGTTPLSHFFEKEPALLVHRFSGTSDAISGDFSGVVKGGYLIENGNRTPVKEVQVRGNFFETLNKIASISSETEILNRSSEIPHVLLSNFSVIGKDE